ncbi:hypothetical protein L6452_38796 [Arctium lappa]|uniref:Uncharacterized protein n=1 Tax=Arctium lappa TaxID=4217 RepID=A0ACB8XR32_ARCLA|nr:hypothetical protein L6452_38796 [Arctium lappa]
MVLKVKILYSFETRFIQSCMFTVSLTDFANQGVESVHGLMNLPMDLIIHLDKLCLEPPARYGKLELVFEDLLERAKEKEKKEGKRRRRLAKDFTELLYNIKDINASSTWEECLQLFEESPAYRSIGDERFARVTFEEYVVSLLEKAEDNKFKQEEKAKKEKKEKNKDESTGVDVDVSESYGHKDRERKHHRRHGSPVKEERDESTGVDVDVSESYGHKDRERKHHRRHGSPVKEERDDSKKSRRHGSGHRRSRKHAYTPESDGESKHKRHKKDGHEHDGGRKELEDGEVREDGEIC